MPSTPRATMADLIARTRLLIADPPGATQQFADSDIQDFLDETRQDIQYETLRPVATYAPGGIQWNDYYSKFDHWEQGAVLLWTNYTTLTPITPTTSDLIRGHWAFSNQVPAVLVQGANYDVWGVAANLLEMRIASMSLVTFDFTSGAGASFHAGQIITNLQKQAHLYRARSRPVSLAMVRHDLATKGESNREARIGPVSSGVPFITGP